MFEDRSFSRRRVLASAGSLIGLGSLRSSTFEDRDGDGIPDSLERSDSHHQMLEEIFGADQFDGLDPERPDLLIDARYVGTATVSERTKTFVETAFRSRGLRLQWLDHPHRYDRETFEESYGYQVERILWPFGSFYEEHIEDALRDIAVQFIVLPIDADRLESLYTLHHGEHFEGVSFGNRCLIAQQTSYESESLLAMHEIGHLVLCHNDDPASVMSPTPEQARFTDHEWELLRANLDNVQDSSGFDIVYRQCLIDEWWTDFVDSLEDGEMHRRNAGSREPPWFGCACNSNRPSEK